jgi:uncharacterized protein (TIGR02594 family)
MIKNGLFIAAPRALTIFFGFILFAVAVTAQPGQAEANMFRLSVIKKVEGLHERKNRKTIQAMVGINPATTPWCGAAAAYAVKKTGGTPPSGYNRAISWTKFGSKVSLKSARAGDVVVLKFARGHHVGIFSKDAGNGRIEVCGGNMSNQFKCLDYRKSNVIAVRR